MKELILLATIITTLTSCGDSQRDEDSFASGLSSSSNQYKSGNCGATVLADHNSMILDCKYMLSREDINTCSSKLTQFQNKYSGINCRATSGYGLDKKEITINSLYISRIKSRVNNL